MQTTTNEQIKTKKMETGKYIITDIEYDTDAKTKKGLPKELTIVIPDYVENTYEDIEYYISEEISNITGFSHKGFATTPEKLQFKFSHNR